MTFARIPWHFVAAMAIIVAASNYLVTIPINSWLVWGSLTYPVAFLVTDLTNRVYGAATARKVVLVGFIVGVALSVYLATDAAGLRIAAASGTAFLIAQLMDVSVFNRLRQHIWWVAPIVSSALSSFVDNTLFWVLAFAGQGDWWHMPMVTDLAVKWGVALAALLPYGLLARILPSKADDQARSALS
jgi:queuosine precursor transporter